MSEDTTELVVAIDGPSGSGKSTVARALADRLGFRYLDTGAMYRAVTWHFLTHQIATDISETELAVTLAGLQLELTSGGRVALGGQDVTEHLRSHEVESRVSMVSAMPPVRKVMRVLQRQIAADGPIVVEGRDMASVVFKNARWKFYIDADPEERAHRRCADFRSSGRDVTESEILEEIEVRDQLDSTRKDAPLVRTEGATYVDTTNMTLQQVIDTLAEMVGDHGVSG
jgi:cytidylate kinase